jgi:hypothetical protein
MRKGEPPMSGIICERFLEKDGIGLEVCITENSPNSYTVSEPTPVRPPNTALRPREFTAREEALAFVEEIHTPGRRSKGWLLIE